MEQRLAMIFSSRANRERRTEEGGAGETRFVRDETPAVKASPAANRYPD